MLQIKSTLFCIWNVDPERPGVTHIGTSYYPYLVGLCRNIATQFACSAHEDDCSPRYWLIIILIKIPWGRTAESSEFTRDHLGKKSSSQYYKIVSQCSLFTEPRGSGFRLLSTFYPPWHWNLSAYTQTRMEYFHACPIAHPNNTGWH